MLTFDSKEDADCWRDVIESWGCPAIVAKQPEQLGGKWEVVCVEPCA